MVRGRKGISLLAHKTIFHSAIFLLSSRASREMSLSFLGNEFIMKIRHSVRHRSNQHSSLSQAQKEGEKRKRIREVRRR